MAKTTGLNISSTIRFQKMSSLGITSDMIMSLCQKAVEPAPNIRVEIAAGTQITDNLV
jgi:hypothetical protein